MNQIKRFGQSSSRISKAETAVKYIRRLGSLDDGRLRAMNLLVEAADEYCTTNGEWNYKSDTYHKGDTELIPMDDLICDLIREHYTVLKKSRAEWDSVDLNGLIDQMDEVRSERYPAWVDFGNCDQRDREDLFEQSWDLLQIVCYRQVATVLASKVTGHRLPAELVDMVADAICSDEELCVRDEDQSKETK